MTGMAGMTGVHNEGGGKILADERTDWSIEASTRVDSAAVSIFVVILVELTNTVFVNSTNITANIETEVLSIQEGLTDLF